MSHFTAVNNTRLFEVAVLPRGRPLLERLLKEGITLREDEEFRRAVVRGEIKEIARGMAHVGVLHWRVWGPLTYLVNPDEPKPAEIEESGMAVDEMSTGTAERDVGSASNVVALRQRDVDRDERERLLREKKRRSLRRRSGQGRWGGGSPPRGDY